MNEISISQIQFFNPWWERPEFILQDTFISDFEKQKFKYIHPLIEKFPLDDDSVFTLRGPRRVGKSTLLKLIIKKLLIEEKVDPMSVFFYTCDQIEDYKELNVLFKEYLDFIKPRTSSRLFIFLDEISFVKEWQRTVKSLYDAGSLRNCTLLLTGSSSLDLLFSSERLAGRRGKLYPWDWEFLPLNFSQFIALLKPEFKGFSEEQANFHLPEYQKLFSDFLITGGFPLTINQYYSKKYLSSDIYEIFLNWIEGDIHKVGKSAEAMHRIVEQIIKRMTTPTSWLKLARESGFVSHKAIEEYFEILERLYVCFKIDYFSLDDKNVFYRKNRKIYFTDPFIFNCMKAKIEGFASNTFDYSKKFTSNEENKPFLIENVVAAQLKREFPFLFYGRSGERKIDFVGKKEKQYFYFEVKYKTKFLEADFEWVKNIIPEKSLTVISKNKFKKEEIIIIPAEIFLGT